MMKRQRAPLKQTTLNNFVKRPCTAPLRDSGFSENTPPGALPSSPHKVNTDFDFSGFDDEWIVKELQFDKWVKCTVVACHTESRVTYVDVESAGVGGHFVARDVWAFSLDLIVGQRIAVRAEFVAGTWTVDGQRGFVSVDPDVMISSTSLVGAMFCRRRGVLATVFRDMDADSRVMAIGSLAHEMFQKALAVDNCKRADIDAILNRLLNQPSTLRALFACDTQLEDARKELKVFVPKILKIIQTYITRELPPDPANFSGAICEILDIEESVVSACIGIKGRIDVTTRVGRFRMPLEVKTGRASFSNEHRSQVILYAMMLEEIGHCTESGLLVYLREGVVREIKATHLEMRDLILLRNDFVRFIRQFDPANLPTPIRHLGACQKCPYLAVCSAYSAERRDVAPPVDASHLEYFREWSQLLLLEDGVDSKVGLDLTLKTILVGPVADAKLTYAFKRDPGLTAIAVGSFVRITPNAYTGRVSHVTPTTVTITVDREIAEPMGAVFTVEGFRSTLVTRLLTNLAMLLEPRYEKLRRIVVDRIAIAEDREIPRSVLTDPVAAILRTLNQQQQRAVLRSLTCKDFLLVQGPPGTGKTQTIVAMVRGLLAINRTVLITGHSHSSVDNILLRLTDVPFLRLGSIGNIDSRIHDKSYVKRVENITTADDLRQLLLDTPVVATTCLGFDTDLATRRCFDVCIVDESTQVLQPETLKPLLAADAFVLVGDAKQLQPVVRSHEARQAGMSVSLFERLDTNHEKRIVLTQQYRMNRVIMNMANQLTYSGVLETGSESIANGVLTLNSPEETKWLMKITSALLADSLLFIDTADSFAENISGCSNTVEAKLIGRIVAAFLARGLTADQIGIMAPFRDQVALLKSTIADVEVNTVDQYQGRDKACVILSCTKQNRSNAESANELLDDERRLCVAVTRAKHKLILVGDRPTLIQRYRPFQRFFKYLAEENVVCLQNGVDGFLWESL